METLYIQHFKKQSGIVVDGCAYSAGFKISDYDKGHYIPDNELKEGQYIDILSKTHRKVCQVHAISENAILLQVLLNQTIHTSKPIAIGIEPTPPVYEKQDRWWEA